MHSCVYTGAAAVPRLTRLDLLSWGQTGIAPQALPRGSQQTMQVNAFSEIAFRVGHQDLSDDHEVVVAGGVVLAKDIGSEEIARLKLLLHDESALVVKRALFDDRRVHYLPRDQRQSALGGLVQIPARLRSAEEQRVF